MDELNNASPQTSAEPLPESAPCAPPRQFRLINLFSAILIVALICGWTMDHRQLKQRLRADSALLQPRRNALAQRLVAEGRGSPLTNFPELGFLANQVRELDDDFAASLKAEPIVARQTCMAYSIDFRGDPNKEHREGEVAAIIVYAVDNTIVRVQQEPYLW